MSWVENFLKMNKWGVGGGTSIRYLRVTYSVVPRGIFMSLNQYGHPNIEPNFFRTRFVKGTWISREVHFLSPSSYSKLSTVASHDGSPSVPLQHTVDICTVMLKKTLQHWIYSSLPIMSAGSCPVLLKTSCMMQDMDHHI